MKNYIINPLYDASSSYGRVMITKAMFHTMPVQKKQAGPISNPNSCSLLPKSVTAKSFRGSCSTFLVFTSKIETSGTDCLDCVKKCGRIQ